MGTTTKQIEAHIEQTRDALSTNLEELQQKVKAATDWRHHFRTSPKILLGVALGGGILLAAIFGGRHNRGDQTLSSRPNAGAEPFAKSARRAEIARHTWGTVKGAVIAAATARLLSYTAEAFLGSRGNSDHNKTTSGFLSRSRR